MLHYTYSVNLSSNKTKQSFSFQWHQSLLYAVQVKMMSRNIFMGNYLTHIVLFLVRFNSYFTVYRWPSLYHLPFSSSIRSEVCFKKKTFMCSWLTGIILNTLWAKIMWLVMYCIVFRDRCFHDFLVGRRTIVKLCNQISLPDLIRLEVIIIIIIKWLLANKNFS